MARFKMDDGAVVNTEKAIRKWVEDTDWNGNNHISVNTHSQWEHEDLYLSSKARYYLVSWSNWQGSLPSARWVAPHEAAQWLLLNGHDLPDTLVAQAEEIEE
jgi:hypothetical protein